MTRLFQIFDAQGNEVFLDKNKQYVKTEFGQIVERDPGTPIDPKSLALVSVQSDIRISEVNFSNLLKVDSKLTSTKNQLISRVRKSFTHTTMMLGVEEFEDIVMPIGSSAFVTKLQLSAPATIQIYSDESKSDTNPYTFISTEDHLIDDGRTLMSDNTSIPSKRTFVLVNRESPNKNNVYAVITNSESVEPIEVSVLIEYISIETIDVTQDLKVTVSNLSRHKSDTEKYHVSGILATPNYFLLGRSASKYKTQLDAAYNTSFDLLSQKLPQRFWPVDEDGGYWTEVESDIDNEITSLYANEFVWDHTPSDGEYALYLRIESQHSAPNISTLTVDVTIKLGSQTINLPVIIPVNPTNTGKLYSQCIKFVLDGGSYSVNPALKPLDISPISTGV